VISSEERTAARQTLISCFNYRLSLSYTARRRLVGSWAHRRGALFTAANDPADPKRLSWTRTPIFRFRLAGNSVLYHLHELLNAPRGPEQPSAAPPQAEATPTVGRPLRATLSARGPCEPATHSRTFSASLRGRAKRVSKERGSPEHRPAGNRSAHGRSLDAPRAGVGRSTPRSNVRPV
jgi:hypothetical protein